MYLVEKDRGQKRQACDLEVSMLPRYIKKDQHNCKVGMAQKVNNEKHCDTSIVL